MLTMLAVVEWAKIIEYTGIALGSIAGTWGFLRWVLHPVKKFFTSCGKFYHNCNYLVNEIKPNGGSSLKDSVEGLKASIDSILSTVIRLDQRQIAIANHHDKGIFETDALGNDIFVNRAYCQIKGCTEAEALGMGWKNTIHPDDRERVVNEFQTCIKERRDCHVTFRCLHPRKAPFLVDVHAYVLRDLRGTLLGYMGFLTPIENNVDRTTREEEPKNSVE